MGRARVSLKPILNERSRKTTFMQRKKGLFKKISEFSTLCRVEACLIIYDDGNGNVGPVTWPQDPVVVRSIIENYDHQRIERPSKTFDIQDFFENRKNMIEAEISKLHKQAREIKYPTWDPSLSNMGEEQLSAFLANVNAKILACDKKIDMLKNVNQDEDNISFMASHPSQPNFMYNISQSQIINTSMELLSNNDERMNFTNATNQYVRGGGSILRNMQQGNACFSCIPDTTQERFTCSQSSQLNCFQNNSQSQLITHKGKNDTLNISNQFVEWTNTPIRIEDCYNPINGDIVGHASKPDISFLKNISTQSHNRLQGVVLPNLPPLLDQNQLHYHRNMHSLM
ncbi:hypothetical protein VNO78_32354 [Psophocarpus tetragonolobus]|uniref:MADS-box domain-containing protein n=1 Tax=Psophocarpus tetragonolobus TaxID=3891 RepID=A0AAN9NWT3_PSOTE